MIKWIKYEFVYGGHLLSLGAASIVWAVFLLSQLNLSAPILALAYLCSQLVYNFDHLEDVVSDKKGNSERTRYLQENKYLQYSLFLLYVLAFASLYILVNIKVFFLAFIIVIGGIIYTKKAKYITRYVIGFKNYYIALFWASLTFMVPLGVSTNPFATTYIIVFVYIYLRWIVNSVYFDIKDMNEDRKKKLKTFPAVWGIDKTVYFLHIVNLLSASLIIVAVYFSVLSPASLILTIFAIYSTCYLSVVRKLSGKKLKLVSYILVDGEYFLWPILLLIAQIVI